MKKRNPICHFLPVLFFLTAGFSAVCAPKPEGWNVRVDRKVPLAPVDSRFWGTNLLFWVDDDQSLADGSIQKSLREMPCNVLRYPGGTVADNFHWKTNMLDNRAMFPYEDGAEETGFDEFMAFCAKVGAEPILVVNTQSWFLKGDIEGGAREAADWVRYCREKGYQVKYWEIGNETYWHPVMTAREYGRLVKTYARAMKAVDPSILISANGHWDIQFSGVKERIDPSLWDKFRQMYLSLETSAQYKALNDYRDEVVKQPNTISEDKWWDGVLGECGEEIDMISVHWYFHNNTIKHLDRKLTELQEYLKAKRPEKNYTLCLTEYNCNEKDDALRVVGLAEGIGRFMNAGVDLSCFWPMRIGGYNNRSMLGLEKKQELYPYQIFQLFGKNMAGEMVRCESADGLYAFASGAPGQMTLVVSGRSLKETGQARVDVGVLPEGAELSAAAYRAAGDKEFTLAGSETAVALSPGGLLEFTVEPGSFVMVTLKNLK